MPFQATFAAPGRSNLPDSAYNPPVSFRSLVPTFVLIGSLLTANPAVAARWYEDYETAVEHIEAGQCSPEAIEALGAAVIDKPKPRRGARTYAQRRIDYLPYYQLARAHLLCGNTDLARQYLERSRTAGIATADELQSIEIGIDALVEAVTAEPTAPPIDRDALAKRLEAARTGLETAGDALAATDEALSRAESQGLGETAWSNRRADEAHRIDELGKRIEICSTSNDLLGLADIAVSATEAARNLDTLTREINQTIERRLAELTPTPTPPVAVAEHRPTPTPVPATTDPAATPSPAVVPPTLKTAAGAYLAGNYESVTATLADPKFDNPVDRAAALMIRGAARIGLARLSDDPARREVFLAEGRSDFRACRTIGTGIRPDPLYFPPAVIEIFNSVGHPALPRPTEGPS